jgi:formylglycine-generating enzyme required for sulfatase activity
MISRLIALFVSIAVLSMSAMARAQEGCIADLDGDGVVNGNDLATVLVGWGSCAGCPGDVNGNGVVNGEDLASVLVRWGGTCAPTVMGFSPDAGHFSGGTTVTITGTRLRSPISVTFGGAAATVVSSTASSITVVAPARPQGPAPLSVATAGGTASAPSEFVYGPWVTSISPAAGSTSGGSLITIAGQLLGGVSSVTIGGVPCTSVDPVNSTTVTATTPAGSVGAATVVVTGAKGTVTVPDGFTYLSLNIPSWATLLEAQPDPAIVTSASLRAAITATGYAWRVRDNASQIEMLLVPPETFTMGCSASSQSGCDSDESPVHAVTLTNAFYMGRYEVTQAQWTARMGSNPSFFQSASAQVPAAQVPNRPVEQVSWDTIQGFLSTTGLRLPTEAEWEYACRAGTTTAFHGWPAQTAGTNNDSLVGNIAWFNSNSNNQTRPVGGLFPNGFGLHDMSGNVWEWVNDWYSGSYYASSPSTNPPGPATATYRVLRGGSRGDATYGLRSSSRNSYTPGNPSIYVGFRVARAP